MAIINFNSNNLYINEIIRITYKCNWKCKFCNVLKTNNFGNTDILDKEVIYKILNLLKKYDKDQIKKLTLSFSGGEPTLNKKLIYFIKLAKSIGVGIVQIQTNGTNLFLNKNLIFDLYESGLDEVFIAQHGNDLEINRNLGININFNEFEDWVKFILDNNLHKKIKISLNIVINNLNIFSILKYLEYLKKIGFLKLLRLNFKKSFFGKNIVSLGLVQPNGYAYINKEVLLSFNDSQINEIFKIINFLRKEKFLPDFHYTSPPLCILYIPDFHLEYITMLNLKKDENNHDINISSYDSFKYLWKEKIKIDLCKKCKYNDLCLGFYRNWINYVGEDYVRNKVNNFLINKV